MKYSVTRKSLPGLEGVEKTTGKDVASLIIVHIETFAKHGKTRTMGNG